MSENNILDKHPGIIPILKPQVLQVIIKYRVKIFAHKDSKETQNLKLSFLIFLL